MSHEANLAAASERREKTATMLTEVRRKLLSDAAVKFESLTDAYGKEHVGSDPKIVKRLGPTGIFIVRTTIDEKTPLLAKDIAQARADWRAIEAPTGLGRDYELRELKNQASRTITSIIDEAFKQLEAALTRHIPADYVLRQKYVASVRQSLNFDPVAHATMRAMTAYKEFIDAKAANERHTLDELWPDR